MPSLPNTLGAFFLFSVLFVCLSFIFRSSAECQKSWAPWPVRICTTLRIPTPPMPRCGVLGGGWDLTCLDCVCHIKKQNKTKKKSVFTCTQRWGALCESVLDSYLKKEKKSVYMNDSIQSLKVHHKSHTSKE